MHTNLTSHLGRALRVLGDQLRRARRGNVAMIFALVAVPIIVAGGAGIDLSRALAVRGKLYTAVDAAALAVASKTGITQAEANTLGQQYFNANYKLNNTFGTPAGVVVSLGNQSVTVTVQSDMPTTLMNVAGFKQVNLTASSNVVWGQNKIWVGLALDNTGSMCEPSSQPCTNPGTNTKIYALKAATKSLLTMFQSTAVNAGDVQVSLIPFARDVKVDTATYGNSSWIDWTEWDETHGSCVPAQNQSGNNNNTKTKCLASTNAGSCSLSGYTSQSTCQNAGTCSISGYTTQSSCNAASLGTCSISGYTTQSTCQSAESPTIGYCSISNRTTQSTCTATNGCTNPDKTSKNSCQNNRGCTITGYTAKNACEAASIVVNGHTINGDWDYGVWGKGDWTGDSGVWTPTSYGVWTGGVWTPTAPVWTADHSGWTGCIEDRGTAAGPTTPTTNSGYDIVNTEPTTTAESKFPAVGTSGCPGATLMGLGYNWTMLDSKVDSMVAQGNTNQTIGLAWAWHSMSQGNPLSPPSLPSNTARHIIILSDGENTENRWYPNGAYGKSAIDDRMLLLCNNAKADGVTVWAVFVNIAGTAGNANSMKNCATGGATGGKYIEVTSASGIGTAFNVIGQQITNLRVAH